MKGSKLFEEGVEPNNGYRMNTMSCGFDGVNHVHINNLGWPELSIGMYSSLKPFPKDPNIENIIRQLETNEFSKDVKLAQEATSKRKNLKEQIAKIVQTELKKCDEKIEKEVKDLFKKESGNILKK